MNSVIINENVIEVIVNNQCNDFIVFVSTVGVDVNFINGTVNQSDGFLLNRLNHTGNQAISTVTGLQDALDAKEDIAETFEKVSKNLSSHPYNLNYTSGVLTSIVYDLGSDQSITKTLNYTDEVLTSVVLSGDTPSGINLTKTLEYTDGTLTGVIYG